MCNYISLSHVKDHKDQTTQPPSLTAPYFPPVAWERAEVDSNLCIS